MKKYNANSGWFNESQRHALARQGIKTGRKYPVSFANGFAKSLPSEPNIVSVSFLEKGSKPKHIGYARIESAKHDDISTFNKFQAFLHKKFTHAVNEKPKAFQDS